MSFESPQALLLLVPVLLLLAWRGRMPGPAGWVRWALAVLLVVALAGPVLHRGGDSVDVVVVVDRSRSMPSGTDAEAEELVGHLEAARKAGQRVGVVTFGREPRLERPLSSDGRLGSFQRPVDAEASDLSEALLAAGELISPDRAGRVFVLSDGLATGADPTGAARRLGLRGIPVDYRRLSRPPSPEEVAVVDVEAPASPAVGEPFLVTATLRAQRAREVGYVLLRNGQAIAKGRARLEAGAQRLSFRDRIEMPGVADYSLRLEGAADAVPENDVGRAVARIAGTPRILLMRPDGKPGALAKALAAAGLQVQVIAPTFSSLDALEGVSAVVLEEVTAQDLGDRAMRVLDAYVRERGGGLLMTGGPNGFGQGGYFRSALEDLLPVSLELRKEQRRSSVAMTIVMDRSGSMAAPIADGRTKMALAGEGAVAALSLLAPGDEASVYVVDSEPHEVVPLTPIEDGIDLHKVASVESMGGGIFVYEGLKAAAASIEQSKLGVRHIVLFADAADSEEPGEYKKLLAALTAKKITVSVIGLGTHEDVDAPLLLEISKLGGGRIYFSDSAQSLPRLFAQEAITLARSSYVDEPTGLGVGGDLTLLGPAQAELSAPPRLDGYNLTYLRPGAGVAYRTTDDNKAPALALWQRGLGRVAALTTSVDSYEARGLMAWPGYQALFGKLVRWLMAPEETGDVLVGVRREGHEAMVVVELDPKAETFSGVATVTLLAGDGSGKVAESPLRSEGDGRLTARFRLTASGSYHPVVRLGSRIYKGAPMTLPYAPEFEIAAPEKGRETLAQIARLTGGTERLSTEGLLQPAAGAPGHLALATPLAAAALVLLLLEVALRRFFFAFRKAARDAAAARVAKSKASKPLRDDGKAASGPVEPSPAPNPPAEEKPAPKPEPAETGVASALETARARAKKRLGG